MSVIAAALRELIAAGVAGDALVDAVERIESATIIKPADYRGPLLEGSGSVCFYCGTGTGHYHIDHVIPRSRGGSDDPENLVISCAPCNLSKGARTPDEWRRQ